MLFLTYAELPERVDANRARALFDSNEYIDAIVVSGDDKRVKQRLAALELLARTLTLAGIDPKSVTLTRNERGRPSVANKSEIDFSLSHTGTAVACAVMIGENARVGVDIEEEQTDDRSARVIKRFFSEEEAARAEREGFAAVWTKKEALFKYLDEETASFRSLDTEKREREYIEVFETEYGKVALCRAKNIKEKAKLTKIMLKN